MIIKLLNTFTKKKDKALYPIRNIELYTSLYPHKEDGMTQSCNIYYLVDKDGFFHHETLPALIIHFTRKEEKRHYYYSHGFLYRKEGSAVEVLRSKTNDMYFSSSHQKLCLKENYSPIGEAALSLISNSYRDEPSSHHQLLMNSVLFSHTGPTITRRGPKVIYHEYRCEGVLHRKDGPAVLCYTLDNKFLDSHWYLEGKAIHKESAT